MTKVMLFVCPHGAGKSRMAAAFFNRAAPHGWWATSAGLEPDNVVSPKVVRLLANGVAETALDLEPPRTIDAVRAADRIIAIDCSVSAAERWDLANQAFDESMRDEIRARAEAIAAEVSES